MADPDLSAIADAIADVLRTDALDAHAFVPPEFLTPPAIYVPVPDLEVLTMDLGVWRLEYELLLIVANGWSESAHADLLGFLPGIKSRIHNDRTLGGVVQGAYIRDARPDSQIRQDNDNGTEWFGARITLEVHP